MGIDVSINWFYKISWYNGFPPLQKVDQMDGLEEIIPPAGSDPSTSGVRPVGHLPYFVVSDREGYASRDDHAPEIAQRILSKP